MADKEFRFTGDDIIAVHPDGTVDEVQKGDVVHSSKFGLEWLEGRPDFEPVRSSPKKKTGGDTQ